jgi:hypothetical protein
MKVITLKRQAPVAPGAATCRLCDARVDGSFQDHLLAGPPGLAHAEAVICPRCGEAVRRLVALFGSELSLIVQEQEPRLETRVGGPARRTTAARRAEKAPRPADSPAGRASAEAELDQTRQQLANEADQLARSERTLREQADRLGRLREPPAS